MDEPADLHVEASETLVRARFPIPDEYVELIAQGGVCGFLRENSNFLDLWSLRKIVEMNDLYEFSDKESMLLIGSDGGPVAFALLRNHGQISYAEVPFVPLRMNEARILANSLELFLETLSAEVV